jgi:hypothetical protein
MAVAAALGQPQSFVSRCESGEGRSFAVELERLARLYGKPITFFLSLTSAFWGRAEEPPLRVETFQDEHPAYKLISYWTTVMRIRRDGPQFGRKGAPPVARSRSGLVPSPVVTYPPEAYLTLEQVAAALQVSVKVARRLGLPQVKWGKKTVRYPWGRCLQQLDGMTK